MTDIKTNLQRAIDHELWLHREAAATAPSSAPDQEILLLLKGAIETWSDVAKDYQEQIPAAVQRQTEQARRLGQVSSIAEMSAIDPDTRRYHLVDMVLHIMKEAVEILESEGAPPPPPPDLRIGKMRR